MAKKIKILRNAQLRAHHTPGRPNIGETIVILQTGDDRDLKEPVEKLTENNAKKYELHVQEGSVYLVEGLDFEFID